MQKINQKLQLKYDMEATLDLCKNKGELTRQIIAEKLMEYKENLMKLGHNLNISDIFEIRCMREKSTESSENQIEYRCAASIQETVTWKQHGFRSQENDFDSLSQASINSSSLLYNEEHASSAITDEQKMYSQPDYSYSIPSISQTFKIHERRHMLRNKNEIHGTVAEEKSNQTTPNVTTQSYDFEGSNQCQHTFSNSNTILHNKETINHETTMRKEKTGEGLEPSQPKRKDNVLELVKIRNFNRNNKNLKSISNLSQIDFASNQHFSNNYDFLDTQAKFNNPINLFDMQELIQKPHQSVENASSSQPNISSTDYSPKDPLGFKFIPNPLSHACSSQYQSEDNYESMSYVISPNKVNCTDMKCSQVTDDSQIQYNKSNKNTSILIQEKVQSIELDRPPPNLPLKLVQPFKFGESIKREPFQKPSQKVQSSNQQTIPPNIDSIETSFSVSERLFCLPLKMNLTKTSTPIREDNTFSKAILAGTTGNADQVVKLLQPLECLANEFVFRTPKELKSSNKCVNLDYTVPEYDVTRFSDAHFLNFSDCQNYSNSIQKKENSTINVSNYLNSKNNAEQSFILCAKTTQVLDDPNDTILTERSHDVESVNKQISQEQPWNGEDNANVRLASEFVSQQHSQSFIRELGICKSACKYEQEEKCGEESTHGHGKEKATLSSEDRSNKSFNDFFEDVMNVDTDNQSSTSKTAKVN